MGCLSERVHLGWRLGSLLRVKDTCTRLKTQLKLQPHCFLKARYAALIFYSLILRKYLVLMLLLSSFFLPLSPPSEHNISSQDKRKKKGDRCNSSRICKLCIEKQCIKENLHAKNMRKAIVGACEMLRSHGGSTPKADPALFHQQPVLQLLARGEL